MDMIEGQGGKEYEIQTMVHRKERSRNDVIILIRDLVLNVISVYAL
jgi:hypothetical protein